MTHSTPNTVPTASQIVCAEPATACVTEDSSSDTSAAPTGFPEAVRRGAQTFTTGGALPSGSTISALGSPVRTARLRSGLERRLPTRFG